MNAKLQKMNRKEIVKENGENIYFFKIHYFLYIIHTEEYLKTFKEKD